MISKEEKEVVYYNDRTLYLFRIIPCIFFLPLKREIGERVFFYSLESIAERLFMETFLNLLCIYRSYERQLASLSALERCDNLKRNQRSKGWTQHIEASEKNRITNTATTANVTALPFDSRSDAKHYFSQKGDIYNIAKQSIKL